MRALCVHRVCIELAKQGPVYITQPFRLSLLEESILLFIQLTKNKQKIILFEQEILAPSPLITPQLKRMLQTS